MIKNLIIIGAGGHAVSVHNIAKSIGYNVAFFVDKNKSTNTFLNTEVISDLTSVSNINEYHFAIAVGDNFVREKIYNELENITSNAHFPPLIHPSCVASFGATIGHGTVAMPNSTIGPSSKVGKFCIINTNSSLDHDCNLDDFSSLAPGCTLGGNVKIGVRSAISMGAAIKHGITVGKDTVVGANSYVNKDLPSSKVAYGNTAKVMRDRQAGDRYLD